MKRDATTRDGGCKKRAKRMPNNGSPSTKMGLETLRGGPSRTISDEGEVSDEGRNKKVEISFRRLSRFGSAGDDDVALDKKKEFCSLQTDPLRINKKYDISCLGNVGGTFHGRGKERERGGARRNVDDHVLLGMADNPGSHLRLAGGGNDSNYDRHYSRTLEGDPVVESAATESMMLGTQGTTDAMIHDDPGERCNGYNRDDNCAPSVFDTGEKSDENGELTEDECRIKKGCRVRPEKLLFKEVSSRKLQSARRVVGSSSEGEDVANVKELNSCAINKGMAKGRSLIGVGTSLEREGLDEFDPYEVESCDKAGDWKNDGDESAAVGTCTTADIDVGEDDDDIRKERVAPKFKIGAIDVDGILKVQENILRERRAPCITSPSVKTSTSGKRRTFQPNRRFSNTDSEVCGPQQIRQSWNEYVDFLHNCDPEFFCSTEARLGESGKVCKGRAAYSGLHVSRENNHDIGEVYDMFYKSKDDVGGSSRAYGQFCCVVGQYLRFAVVCGVADVETVCEAGMTFEAVTHSNVAVTFLTYFDVRATVSTVLTKALHLKKALFYAKMHFRRANDLDKVSKAEYCDEHVSSIFNARKRLSRLQSSRLRAVENRIAQGSILYPQDFIACMSRARSSLEGIEDWYNSAIHSCIKKGQTGTGARKAIGLELEHKKELIQKWCINFTALVILAAGGQRPQVFSQLLCPDLNNLDRFVRVSKKLGYCEIATVSEKTVRSVNVPFVVFLKSMLPYLVFHVRVIRPILASCSKKIGRKKSDTWRKKDSKTGNGQGRNNDALEDENSGFVDYDSDENIGDENDGVRHEKCLTSRQFDVACNQLSGFSGYLLLNTRNGQCLSTGQIGTVFRQFLKRYDPELCGVSTRSIRPSYATMMFRGWLSGKIHPEKNEVQFLQHMAMMMNTSVEQLKSTYISIDRGDYDKTVKGMVAAFTAMVGNAATSDEDENDDDTFICEDKRGAGEREEENEKDDDVNDNETGKETRSSRLGTSLIESVRTVRRNFASGHSHKPYVSDGAVGSGEASNSMIDVRPCKPTRGVPRSTSKGSGLEFFS